MSKFNLFGMFAVIMLLLNVMPVSALQENFEVGSTVINPVACSYSVTTNTIIIRNTGDVPSTYDVSASGGAAEFTIYSDSHFTLNPGESKTLFQYYAPGDRKGSYDLKTTITTQFGNSKTVEQTVSAENCANIGLTVKTPVVNVKPCNPAQFSFIVKNLGDFAETYEFGLKGMEKYSTITATSLFLAPGESHQVDLFVNADCGIYGEKEITFQALAKTTQYLAEAKVLLNIARDYDYGVQIAEKANICNYKQTEIPISLSNKVPILNQYYIKVDAPVWMKQTAYRVELAPLGSGTTSLVADKPVNPGVYNIDIKTTSVRGDIVKAGTQEIIVENCYDSDVNIGTPADIIVQGHTVKYPITIKNEGTKTDSYDFTLESPVFVSSDAQKVTVNAGQTKTFNLTINANTTGNFEAKFTAHSAETGKNESDFVKFNVISQEKAYSLDINPGYTRVLLLEDSFKVTLQNKGILPATYDLTLKGPAWAKLPADSITLQPDQKAILIIPTTAPKNTQLGNYEAELTATVKGENVGFVSKFTINLRDKTLVQEAIVFCQVYWLYLTILAAILLLALFWVVFGSRIRRAWRNIRIRAAESAKFRAEIRKQREEERKAAKLLEEAQRIQKQQMKEAQKARKSKPSGFWNALLGIILVVIALGIIAAGFLAMAGYMPFVSEMFKQTDQNQKFAPIIKVNTTGLEAYGNTVIIRSKEVVIPVIVKNNYNDDLVFDVQVNANWIKTNTKQIELEAGEQEVLTLRVIPDETVKGVYKVGVTATLIKENKKFTENITLNVRKQSFMQDLIDYAWYIACGIFVVIILMLIFKGKGTKVKHEKNEKPLQPKPARKISIEIPVKK